jgi:transposase-like protein
MADELRIGLTELLRKAHIEGDAEFLKEGVRALSQALMEMEVEEHIGATRHERTPGRKGQLKRLPPEDLGHEGRSCGALSPEGEGW